MIVLGSQRKFSLSLSDCSILFYIEQRNETIHFHVCFVPTFCSSLFFLFLYSSPTILHLYALLHQAIITNILWKWQCLQFLTRHLYFPLFLSRDDQDLYDGFMREYSEEFPVFRRFSIPNLVQDTLGYLDSVSPPLPSITDQACWADKIKRERGNPCIDALLNSPPF